VEQIKTLQQSIGALQNEIVSLGSSPSGQFLVVLGGCGGVIVIAVVVFFCYVGVLLLKIERNAV